MVWCRSSIRNLRTHHSLVIGTPHNMDCNNKGKLYFRGWDWETFEEQSQEHVSNFLTLRGLFAKNSSWQTKYWIPHSAVTFYGDWMKMREDFTPNFGYKRTDCCTTSMHCLTLPFQPGNFFMKKRISVHSTLLFPQLKIKMQDRNSDKTEVIEAESKNTTSKMRGWKRRIYA
jgi:hypothetical protein